MPGARRPILTDSRRNRNPYGSRGGYVDSRRDYAGRRMGTGPRGRDYGQTPFEQMQERNRYDMNQDYDYNDYADYNDYDYGMDYNDYGDYDYNDYVMDYERDYRRGGRRDYRSNKLEKEDYQEWIGKLMEEVDHKDSEMFKKDKIMQKAQELGIKPEGFTMDDLYLTTIMMYTDYYKTLGNANISIYVKLAKDWLMDKDVSVKGSEKLASYYENIVK
jgi:hypothetical protein